MEVTQASKDIESKTETELLIGRIRLMTSISGLNRDECHETIMSAKNPPSEEEFYLAYAAAVILNGGK